MKRALILILLNYYSLNCIAMEMPSQGNQPTEEQISPELAIKLSEEKQKFEKYDLDHPENFLNKLRTQLNPKQNLIQYLENLQRFASKLLYQQLFIQQLIIWEYIYSKGGKLAELTNHYMNEMGLKKEVVRLVSRTESLPLYGFKLLPETEEQLNEMTAHSGLLTNRKYSARDIDALFLWILDKSKGSWLNKLGLALKADYENKLLAPLEYSEWSKIHDLYYNTWDIWTPTKQEIRLINENTQYLGQLLEKYEALQKGLEKLKSLQATKKHLPKITVRMTYGAFYLESIKDTDLYTRAYSWYAKLYELIRKEMGMTIAELLRENPQDKSVIKYLDSLPAEAVQEKLVPKILPSRLPEFIKLPEIVKLPSLDAEFDQARIEWEKNHPSGMEEKKVEKPKKKRRRKISAEKEASAICPIIEEEVEEIGIPEKIKEGKDGSYILEGDDTDKRITIHDPKNNTIEVIFKTDKPFRIKQHLPPIAYTNWVTMWFEDPEKAREIQGYNNPKNKRYRAGEPSWKPAALHAFSVLVDDYIREWGTATTIPSRREKSKEDILVTLPGMIIFPDGKQETGVFGYLIDSKTGEWYHRMFEPQSRGKILSDLFEKGYFSPEMTGYYDVYFPPLRKK